MHETQSAFDTLRKNAPAHLLAEIEAMEKKWVEKKSHGTWERVLAARSPDRLTAPALIAALSPDFFALHGDRSFADDGAIIGGIGTFSNRPVTWIGIAKGRTLEENMARHFGMPQPEGYRKAQRLIRQAQKFGRPVLCLIDTPGAACGVGAEERGQGQAIAETLRLLAGVTVPTMALILGEGGSGGALALAFCDRVYMVDRSIYAILSPEGFASILYKDEKKAAKIAPAMQILPEDLLRHGLIDGILPTPKEKEDAAVSVIEKTLSEALASLEALGHEKRQQRRYDRYRTM